MRLYAEEDDIDGPHFFERAGDRGSGYEISISTLHLHAVLLHGAKMRAARKERGVEAGLRHARTDVGSNGARPGD